MWARVVEIMFGCWLAISPFVFRHPPDEPRLWWNDFACAVLVVTPALLSFHPRMRRAHLSLIAVGLWLIASGYIGIDEPVPAAVQNNVLVGWLILMFAVIPSHNNRPPAAWEKRLRADRR